MNILGPDCRPPYLVVRNSMSLLAFSSVSAAVSTSSTSWVICGRFPLLPPRLMLEDVELELRPESGTGDDWSSLRKSKPPGGKRRQQEDGLGCQQVCSATLKGL